MKKSKSAFTIVEIVVVISVIAALVTISVIVYRGTQARARDTARYNDVKAIMKGLDVYKGHNGRYPTTGASTTLVSGCTPATIGSGYSYSIEVDSPSTWLSALVTGNYMKPAPLAPNNSCTSYYRYLYVPANTYGCTRGPYYILQVVGTENTFTPSDAETAFTPCAGAPTWPTNSTRWTFQRDE